MSSLNLTERRQRAAKLLARTRAADPTLKPQAIAEQAGVSRQQVYAWEAAGPPLDDESLARIEKAYGLSPGALVAEMLIVGSEGMDYWRGRVDEIHGFAADVSARLAALSALMQSSAQPKALPVRAEDIQAAEDGDRARADLEAKIAGAKKRPRGSAGGGGQAG